MGLLDSLRGEKDEKSGARSDPGRRGKLRQPPGTDQDRSRGREPRQPEQGQRRQPRGNPASRPRERGERDRDRGLPDREEPAPARLQPERPAPQEDDTAAFDFEQEESFGPETGGNQRGPRSGRDRGRDTPPEPPQDYNLDLPGDEPAVGGVEEELHRISDQNERIIDLLRQIRNSMRP